MICPKCGNQILEDANFCRNCGAALHTRDEDARSGQGEKKRKKGLFHQPAVVLAGVVVLLLAVSGGVFGYYGLRNENGMAFLIKNKDGQNQEDKEQGKQGGEDSGDRKQGGVLIFNENADFVPVSLEWEGIPKSMSEFLERENRGRGVLKVRVIDGRIIQAVDMGNNYAG